MPVEIIVPWRGGCPHRERALEWSRRRSPWPVTVAEAPPGPWCKANAAMPAVEASDADLVVLADADVWTDGLQGAVNAVLGGAPWAIPHRAVYRLDETGTEAVLARKCWRDQPLARRVYLGVEGGGYVVARRETLLEIPLDPRFVGWGQEDMSWALAMRCLVGAPWRGSAPLVHLYHPLEPRLTDARGSWESFRLYQRYHHARLDPIQMRSLVEEARVALATAEPAGHDHAAQRVG